MCDEFDVESFEQLSYSVFRVLSDADAAEMAEHITWFDGDVELPPTESDRPGTAASPLTSTGGRDPLSLPALCEIPWEPKLLAGVLSALEVQLGYRVDPGDVVLDNFKLYCAKRGQHYNQGWHRE